MKSKLLLVALIAVFMSGCATNITNARRTDDRAGKIYKAVGEAALDTAPLSPLNFGAIVNLDITVASPAVAGEKGNNKFEVLGLIGKKDQEFTISIMPLCDCLGVNKWLVSPDPYLLNTQGEIVAQIDKSGPPPATNVRFVVKTLKGKFAADGEYKLAMIADNTHEGQKIAETGTSILMVGFIPVPIPSIDEVVHPTGKVQVQWIDPQQKK